MRKTGSDGAAGTSAGAAWATIGKALGAAGIASGDTVYVGAGVYREAVSCALTSPTAETFVIADIDGGQTGDAGPVIWTAYTTNDATTPSTSATINLNQKDFLTFDGFWIVGGNRNTGMCVTSSQSAGAAHSKNIKFKRCSFEGGYAGPGSDACLVFQANGAQEPSIWSFDRCLFFVVNHYAILAQISQFASGADWDEQVTLTNCLCIGPSGNLVNLVVDGSANTFKPGGYKISYCTHMTNSGIFVANNLAHSTTIASDIEHCLISSGSSAPINAVTAGQLVRENHNRIVSGVAVSANVTAGGSSDKYSDAAIVKKGMFDFGQSWLFGMQGRPFGTPYAGSNLLGVAAGGNISAQTIDLVNRPRPAGGAITAAVGALERHDTARVGSSLGADAGGYSEIVGPGDELRKVWCSAASTTVSVKVKWDSNHGDTTKPQLVRLANGAIGVTETTVTATGTAGSGYETLSTTFTPTAAGEVRFLVKSRAAAANGILAFDTWSVT